MQIQPASFAFTLLLGFLAAVPYSGIDINLPALEERRHAWREPLGSRPDDERIHA
jgi:MFS transporter, DHA1 family, multidrug resistance protein